MWPVTGSELIHNYHNCLPGLQYSVCIWLTLLWVNKSILIKGNISLIIIESTRYMELNDFTLSVCLYLREPYPCGPWVDTQMDFSDRPQCHFLRGLFLPVEVDLFFNKKKNNIRYCLYHSFFKIKALSKDEALLIVYFSGLLVSYLTLHELEKRNGKINWLLFYFHRFWR